MNQILIDPEKLKKNLFKTTKSLVELIKILIDEIKNQPTLTKFQIHETALISRRFVSFQIQKFKL